MNIRTPLLMQGLANWNAYGLKDHFYHGQLQDIQIVGNHIHIS